MKRLSLILLFSTLAFCMLNFSGGNVHSDAQIAPNAPGGVQSIPSSPSLAPSSPVPLSPSSPVPLGVKITSHTTGQQVPTGQLTISGTSTDTPNANCEVYTDVNDLKPMQKVAASGPGGNNDYSAWTFTYTPAYSLIKNGTNNLTSKISCIDSSTTGNLTKWNSVNVTGVDGLVLQQTPPSIISAVGNNTNNTGLLISQSAALGTFEPTVATVTSDSGGNSDNDNDNDKDNDNDNDSFEESIEAETNDDDDEQDNAEVDEETNTADDEENGEEADNTNPAGSDNTGDESNDQSATVANEANDVSDNENNSDNINPSNSNGNDDENTIVESNSVRNEVNSPPESDEESTINENNINENLDLFANEESADVASESETDEDSNDEDECDIGDRGFPFCDDRPGEELFDDEEDEDGEDECDIGDRGFPFCDGRID